jgi:phage terminase Nu1 subunit (DNA packaging protein)
MKRRRIANPDDRRIEKTQRAVAERMGVAVRTVQYWIHEGMPVLPEGQYDIDMITEWRARRMADQKTEKDPQDPDVRFRTAKAKLAEMELAKRMGDLLPREEVEAQWLNVLMSLKKELLALPKALTPRLARLEAKEIQVILSQHVRGMIEAFQKA